MSWLQKKVVSAVIIILMVVLAVSPSAMAAPKDGDIYQKCEDHKRLLLSELEKYVNIDSGNSNEAGLKQFHEALVSRLQAMGAEVTSVKAEASQGSDTILAIFRGTGTGNVLILAHTDTAFPAGTVRQFPYSTDGVKAYGPGISSGKGGLTLALHAMDILKETRFQDYERIMFVINPDKERNSAESRDFIMEAAKEHKYTLSMEPGMPGDAVMNWRKGVGRLIMKVTGRNAHIGIDPEKGRNATAELAYQITQLSKLGNNSKMTTVNWTLLDSTKTPAVVIPNIAWALADVRVLSPEENERVLSDARRIAEKQLIPDTKVEFTLLQVRPPFAKSDKNDKLVAHLQDIYKNELGLTLGVQGSSDGSDANYAALAGAITVDGLGIIGGNQYTLEEYIELDSVTPRLYLLTRILMDIGSGSDTRW